MPGATDGDMTFKVHVDGYDQRDLLAVTGADKYREFFDWADGGNLGGPRIDLYNAVFMEQQAAVLLNGSCRFLSRGCGRWVAAADALRVSR
jgi:hypothetical protein